MSRTMRPMVIAPSRSRSRQHMGLRRLDGTWEAPCGAQIDPESTEALLESRAGHTGLDDCRVCTKAVRSVPLAPMGNAQFERLARALA
jgi:hypothetical protein